MKISIIVPVYNNAEFVRTALESVKCQDVDLKEIELIVINDGSEDNSEEVIDAFVKENDFAIKISQENQGVSAARNAGLDIATGDYIGFLDSDDAYSPSALADMLFIAEKWDADMVVGESRSVGTFQTTVIGQSRDLSKKAIIRRDDPLMAYNFSCCNKIFRREVIEKNHLRFQKIKHAEDGLFLFSFLEVCNTITGCPKYIYEYHKRISLESKSALKSLDMSMFDSAIQAANSINKITNGFSDAFKEELDLRMLRVTLINEYYRRLWTLDDETETALLDEVEKYRKKLGEDKWKEINSLGEDLEADNGLKTKEEILENPLISVLIPTGLNPSDFHDLLSTLYFQVCPNFEVIIDESYKSEMAEEFLSSANLFFCNTQNDGWKALIDQSRGRFVQIAAEPCIYNENTLQLMYRRMLNSYKDFISIKPLYYFDGEVEKIPALEQSFKKNANISDEKRHIRNRNDRIWSNKMFRRAVLEEVFRERIQHADEAMDEIQRKYTCDRFTNVLIALTKPLPYNAVMMEDNKKKKHRIQWFVIMRHMVYRISRMRPLKEKDVLFLSDIREELGGNYLPLYEPLKQKGYNVICDFKSSKKIKDPKDVYIRRMIHLARAKYIVLEDFHVDTADIRVRKGQELVQLWHACGAYKKFAWSRAQGHEEISIHPGYKKYTKAITSAEEICPIYADAYRISPDKVKATGIPRTDLFFEKEYIQTLRGQYEEKYPLLKGKKIVLFAPTYRGTSVGNASYPFEKCDPEMLQEALGDEYVFIYKWHPAIYANLASKNKKAFDGSALGKYAIDLSKERDINELMIISDILVTDYSSVIFEYGLMRKPIIYYWFDINENHLGRSAYFEMEDYVYGNVAYDEDELIEALQNPDLCMDKRQVFMERFMSACDGHSTEKTIDWVFNN